MDRLNHVRTLIIRFRRAQFYCFVVVSGVSQWRPAFQRWREIVEAGVGMATHR